MLCIIRDICNKKSVYFFQVSCLWQGPHLLTVSLSGFITYLDVNNPDKPIRVIKVSLINSMYFNLIYTT